MSKFLNISTDTTLGGNSASDDTVASQKAVKSYVDSQTGTAPAFANITGQPTDNANLATALAGKVPTSRTINSKALTSDVTLTASDVGALPDSTVIPTVNNATLTITQGGTTKGTFTANASSNVTIDLDSGGTVDVDNSTITLNSSDQIQTVAVKDNNNNAIKTWTGTRSQYDSITTKDSNTLYNITDDTDVTLTLLNTLYPVGAIYIGTMNACPLQVLGVGTWQLVSSGRVLQGVSSGQTTGTTVEAGLPNIEATWTNDNRPESGYHTDGTGAVSATSRAAWGFAGGGASSTSWDMTFDASLSNPIYGNSDTVQPPAYLVNIWERIQ